MLQAIISGFGGLEITKDDIIQLKAGIPSGWKKLTITGVGVEDKSYTIE